MNRFSIKSTLACLFTVSCLMTPCKSLADINANSPEGVMKQMGFGWNLGNQFDAAENGVADETCWGNPKASEELIDFVAASGIKTLRLPVTWLGHFGDAPEYKLDAKWLDRIAEVAEYAEKAGLNVIINIHHDGADGKNWLDIKGAANDPAVQAKVISQIKAIWTQIAERFKDKGDWLMMESFNEIHDGGWGWGDNRNDEGRQYEALNQWNQAFVDAVRATGGNNATRYLGVPGYCTNPALTIEHFKMPVDPASKTMVAVHFYDPFNYTLSAKFSEWGKDGKNKDSWGDEDNVDTVFNNLKEKFVDNGVPVYIGEMGCVNRDNDSARAFRLYYLDYVVSAARKRNIPCIIWDNGAKGTGNEQSGIFDRANATWWGDGEKAVDIMVKAAM